MYHFKRFFVPASLLLASSLLFAFTSLASTAFAATATAQRISSARASTITHEAVAPTAFTQTCPPNQSENSSGNTTEWVEVIQFRLNSLVNNGVISPSPFPYPYPLTIDGGFGSNTYKAVVDFQFSVGIGSSGGGVVGTRTWAAMGLCTGYPAQVPSGYSGYSYRTCPANLSEGGSNDAYFVKALQDMLNMDVYEGVVSPTSPDSGWWPLSVDGSFGLNTEKGVVNFQHANYISGGGGVAGNRTWAAMGMCFY